MAEAEAKLSQKLAQIIGNENYYYVAVKGSPFAMDCVAFGLTKDEVLALSKRFPNTGTDVVNGVVIKGSPLEVINALSELGYRVVCSTGEAEILWTLQRENQVWSQVIIRMMMVHAAIANLETQPDRLYPSWTLSAVYGMQVSSIIKAAWPQKTFKYIDLLISKVKQNNDLDRVKSLLNKGTSPDVEDAAEYTALHYAARNGHDKVCKELLYRGANVNAVTRSGKATALHRAATQKHVHIVELLLKANADANIQDADGFTALHRSITSDCDAVTKLLIPKTKLDLMDKSGCTPRQLAEQKGKTNLFF
ncbi:hypothetical protein TSAR_003143 [Trichomalopsis sarcophagae]|uniref:Uncharacterized protein n=1 Tax=Trichomalopsis sarcophagae TaxID=543379 RepID=A0A232FCP6_9HYME|nr:hypothetical protein TSAR_003143 [Trichomalopsis sarcophagae]